MDPVSHTFSIDLYRVADSDSAGGYHQRNLPGEIQRQHIIYMENHSKELTLQGELLTVVHGKYDTKNGDSSPATFCIFQFCFSGSDIGGRRFRKAVMEVSFGHQATLGSSMDPEVMNIAPEGDFVLDNTVHRAETTMSAHVALKGAGPITILGGVNIGFGWERKAPSRKEGQVTLSGLRKTVHRDYGTRNTAKWVVKENNVREAGIPPRISTAVLLKPKDGENFQAIVTVDVEIDAAFHFSNKIRRLLGRIPVDPVFFSQSRVPMGPKIPGLDGDNLVEGIKIFSTLGSIGV